MIWEHYRGLLHTPWLCSSKFQKKGISVNEISLFDYANYAIQL